MDTDPNEETVPVSALPPASPRPASPLGRFLRSVPGALLVIAVTPEQRRRGLGRALLDQAIAICALADCPASERWFELSVAADNRAARRLFEQAGLAPVDVPTSSYPNGQRSIRMRRVL